MWIIVNYQGWPQHLWNGRTFLEQLETSLLRLNVHHTHLAQREVVEEGRGTVRLSEGEGRGVVSYLQPGTAVLGCYLRLEGTPVVWVREQSLWGEKT